jgi:hypothetical protein
MNIIQDSLAYYDKNNLKYSKYMDKVNYIQYKTTDIDNTEGVVCIFYDKNKKILFSSRIELIGKHYIDFNMWVWGWGLPFTDKSLINIIKKIFIYATDIYLKQGEHIDTNYIILKQNLLTSRLLISTIMQVDIYRALSSYLSKVQITYMLPSIVFNLNDHKMVDTLVNIKDNNTSSGLYYFILDPPNIDNT